MSSFNKETTVFEQPYSRNRNNHFSSSSSSFSSNTSSSSRSSNNDECHTHSHSNSHCPVTTQKPRSNSNSTTKARVPFSWEHQPGIPKRLPSSFTKPNSDSSNNNGDYSSYSNSPRLPLPPASSTNSKNNHRRKPKHHRITGSPTTTTTAAAANTGTLIWRIDPFLAALVECSKDNITDDDHHNSSDTTTKHHTRNVNNGTQPSIWKGGNDQKVVKKSYGGITTRSNDHMMSRLGMFNYLYQLSCKRNMMTGNGNSTCGVISDSIVQRPGAKSSTSSSSSSSSRRLGTYYHGGRRSTSS